MIESADSGTGFPFAMSANCRWPPGFSTRQISSNAAFFIRAKVDDAVAYHGVGPPVVDGKVLKQALSKFDVLKTHSVGGLAALLEHRIEHIDANYASFRAHLLRGYEAIKARPGASVDDLLSALQAAQRKWVRHAGERLDRSVGHFVDHWTFIAQALCVEAARVEVVLAVWIARHFPIFFPYFFPKHFGINTWCCASHDLLLEVRNAILFLFANDGHGTGGYAMACEAAGDNRGAHVHPRS
jgi:hypothetical protein